MATVRWILPLILCLLTVATPPAGAAPGYVDPVLGTATPSRVLRGFDPPEHNWLPGHRGVDLKAAPAARIHAAGAGTVAFAGVVAGTPVISIDHPEGIRTTYQPVTAWVAAGDQVTASQPIGILASTDRTHPGLHWGARPAGSRDRYLNPLDLLGRPVIRLKPVDGLAQRPV